MSPDTRLLSFYEGRSPDNRGRTLDEILRWPDHELEFTHDYIQWLFPLRERSGFNPEAPMLDDTTIAAFRNRPELRKRLRTAFLRMLSFYGFQVDQVLGALAAVRAENFPERSQSWLTPSNHNHLRLTRILKSLRLLGLEAESAALFRALEDVYRADFSSANPAISTTTFQFWQSASR